MQPTPNTPRILIVDDEVVLAQLYAQQLRADGFTVEEAYNGEAAIEVSKTFMPHLILLDLMMPRLSGFDAIDLIRNTPELKDTKIIVMSGLGQEDDMTRAKSMGADDYIVKGNTSTEEVVARIKAQLGMLQPSAVNSATTPGA